VVEEHVLFQSIWEIRALFPNLDVIKTHPRKGYQWTIALSASEKPTPVLDLQGRFTRKWPLMATLLAIISAASILLGYSLAIESPQDEMLVSPSTTGNSRVMLDTFDSNSIAKLKQELLKYRILSEKTINRASSGEASKELRSTQNALEELLFMGLEKFSSKDFKPAEHLLRSALIFDSNHVLARQFLVHTLISMEQYVEAEHESLILMEQSARVENPALENQAKNLLSQISEARSTFELAGNENIGSWN